MDSLHINKSEPSMQEKGQRAQKYEQAHLDNDLEHGNYDQCT